MQSKSNRNKSGRKKFSEFKQLGPDKTVQENLAIASMGEFAKSTSDQEIFQLVARWNFHAPDFTAAASARKGTRLARQLRREQLRRGLLVGRLVAIIGPALEKLDAKPFERFGKAVELAKNLNRNGALLRDTHEVLRVVDALDLELGSKIIQTVKSSNFTALLRRKINTRQFARIKKQIGLHFKSGRPKG